MREVGDQVGGWVSGKEWHEHNFPTFSFFLNLKNAEWERQGKTGR